jgi:serine/threonine protein phosphatase PrpC
MGNYKICGYSTIGKSHEDKGIKCQDYCFFKRGDGFIVATVADGLSTCKHSDIASHTAAEIETIIYIKIKMER